MSCFTLKDASTCKLQKSPIKHIYQNISLVGLYNKFIHTSNNNTTSYSKYRVKSISVSKEKRFLVQFGFNITSCCIIHENCNIIKLP